MPRHTPPPPTFDKKRNRWKASLPAGLAPAGKRVRTWHPTRDAARQWLETAAMDPAQAIPAALAADAAAAAEILAPLGVSLRSAASALAEAATAAGGLAAVLDACRAVEAARMAAAVSVPFRQAALAFLAEKETTIRTETIRGYRQNLLNDLRSLADLPLSSMTGEALMQAVDGMTPFRAHGVLTSAVACLNWAARSPRRWIDAGPIVRDIHKPALPRDSDITTLDPEACRALLHTAERINGRAAVCYAIALFAGVRLGEVARLRWSNITDGHLIIDAGQAKRHRRRAIVIGQALAEFIAKHRPADAAPQDTIAPPSWVNVDRLCRRAAGWDLFTSMALPPGTPKAHRGTWPQNCLRHTNASALIALGVPIEKMIFEFGHSGGTALLQRHYVGRMTSATAAEIMAIRPA
jgi:integrase